MNDWDPNQYLEFADKRFRAAVELLERVPLEAPETVADIGCGTGEITRLIADHWPSAHVCGIDNSEAMLQRARDHSTDITWTTCAIQAWTPDDPFDLIYSNAALHWVDDHKTLFPRLVGYLRTRGCLAVQMPLSWHARSHQLMRETLADGGPNNGPLGTTKLRKRMARKPVQEARWYYDLLVDAVVSLDIWETEYLHILQGEDAVLEWVRGTGLRPILTGLGTQDRTMFLDTYRRRLADAYPPDERGNTLYPFRRLFIVACR